MLGLFDELKDMAGAVEKAASEHPDQVKAALAKLEGVIDEQTGGRAVATTTRSPRLAQRPRHT